MTGRTAGARPIALMRGALRRERVRQLTPAVVVVSILVIAAVLRLALLGSRDLFRDEAASWLLAHYPWTEILPRMSAEPYPPLYPFMLKAWMTLFGDGAGAIRALSAFAGVGTVCLTWAWARTALGRGAAGVAAVVMALSPLALTEARQVRMYAVETLVATLAWWSIWWLLTRGTGSRRLYGVALVALAVAGELWTMPTGIVAVGLQVLVVAIAAWRRNRGARGAALGLAVGVASFIPWLPTQLGAAAGAQTYWTTAPSLLSIPQTLATMLAGWIPSPALAVVPLLVALAGAGLIAMVRAEGERARLTAIVIASGIGLIGAWWLASFIRSAYDARYLGAALPFLAMAIGEGTIWGWRVLRRRAGPRLALLVALGAAVLFASGTVAFARDWLGGVGIAPARAVVDELERRVRPGDVVLAVDSRSYFPVAYEVGRAGAAGVAGPLWYWRTDREPAYFGGGIIGPERSIAPQAAERDGRLVLPGLEPGGSIWLVALTNGTHELAWFTPLSDHEVVVSGETIVRDADWAVPIYRLEPVRR